MSTIDRIVYMANQIATNLETEPDPAFATAEHIRLYWDPRMRLTIAELESPDLCLNAAEAIKLLKDC